MGNQVGSPPVPNAPPPPPPSPPIDDASTETSKPQQPTASGGIEVKGKWCYVLRPRKHPKNAKAARAEREKHLTAVAFYGYKIGVKIKATQQVEAFAFTGKSGEFLLVQDAATTTALAMGLPTDPDEKWVGFVAPAGTSRKPLPSPPLTICYRFRLVVSPVPHPPQAIVMVATYPPVAFEQHHLKTIVLLSPAEKKLRVTTSAQV